MKSKNTTDNLWKDMLKNCHKLTFFFTIKIIKADLSFYCILYKNNFNFLVLIFHNYHKKSPFSFPIRHDQQKQNRDNGGISCRVVGGCDIKIIYENTHGDHELSSEQFRPKRHLHQTACLCFSTKRGKNYCPCSRGSIGKTERMGKRHRNCEILLCAPSSYENSLW